MQKFLLKLRYFGSGLLKALKKLTLFFLSSPVPFNGQSYKNQKEPELEISHSSGYKTSSEKILYLLYTI